MQQLVFVSRNWSREAVVNKRMDSGAVVIIE